MTARPEEFAPNLIVDAPDVAPVAIQPQHRFGTDQPAEASHNDLHSEIEDKELAT